MRARPSEFTTHQVIDIAERQEHLEKLAAVSDCGLTTLSTTFLTIAPHCVIPGSLPQCLQILSLAFLFNNDLFSTLSFKLNPGRYSHFTHLNTPVSLTFHSNIVLLLTDSAIATLSTLS